MTHLTFEQISDLADSRAENREHPHLSECGECRETLRRVGALIAAAHTLPRDIAPPPDVWTALRSRVKHAPLARPAPSRWRYGGLAAAAAVILMVGTAVLMPRSPEKARAPKTMTPATAAPAPKLHLAVEKNYSATLTELRRTLDAQPTTLSPATVRVLERSLATIDTAIAEAREALANDPANQALVGILSANYERKVELLKRATELSSSS